MPDLTDVAALSDEIRTLTDQRSEKARERRTLMLRLNRARRASYVDLSDATGTHSSWVAAELARARREQGLDPIPLSERGRPKGSAADE